MNVIVHNRRNLYFQIPDLDLEIRQFEDRTGVTVYIYIYIYVVLSLGY